MPFQILDLILLGIMLISGLLAVMRGFTREVLSLLAWGLAAVAAYFAINHQPLVDLVMPYVDKPVIAKIIVAAIAFILVLIIVSVVSVKISDAVVDSSAGAFDRTLGFVYGTIRGLVLVAIAYLFYSWLVPADKREDWVRNAQSLPVIQMVSGILVGLMPPDIAETLENSARIGNPEGETVAPPADAGGSGLTEGQTQGLDNLIDNTTGGTSTQPATQPELGQSTGQ